MVRALQVYSIKEELEDRSIQYPAYYLQVTYRLYAAANLMVLQHYCTYKLSEG